MRTLLFGLIGTIALLSTDCFAISLSEARSSGFVCEMPNGLLRNTGGGGDVDTLVLQVNEERMVEYQNVSNSSGAPLAETQNTFGNKLRAKYPAC